MASLTESLPTPVVFQGASSLAITQTIASTDCPGLNNIRTLYYDSQLSQTGFNISGGEFGVAQAPIVLPAKIQSGSSGALGTFDVWTDSSMSVPIGTLVASYRVQALSSTTALITITKQSYNLVGALTETDEYEYQITTQGTVSVSAFDYVSANILMTAE